MKQLSNIGCSAESVYRHLSNDVHSFNSHLGLIVPYADRCKPYVKFIAILAKEAFVNVVVREPDGLINQLN